MLLWKLFVVFTRVALFSRGEGTKANPVWAIVGAAVLGLVVY